MMRADEFTIEHVREFWDRRPCNVRHSTKPSGTLGYFQEVERRKYFVEPHIPEFAQFSRWKGRRVLELGCGIGTDSVNFARAGAHLTAVDLSERSLDVCRQRLKVYGLQAELHCGNIEDLGSFLTIQHFDLIYSFGVIHHTPNPEKVLAEIRKFCSPDTEVRVMLYSKWSWKVLWILLTYGHGAIWRLQDLVRTYSEAQTGCPVTYYYSFREIAQLFKGFHIHSIRKEHIFPYIIEKYVQYEYEREWYFRVLPLPLFRWLEHQLGWHTLVVAKARNESLA
jgi:2-polyprenyl-3-methyl-5-hydroxy-6-metoxy-1,4-benzoquinol methylase